MKRSIIFTLLIVMSLSASARHLAHANQSGQTLPVLAHPPVQQHTAPVVTAIGHLQAPRDIWITSKINGYINSIHFHEGDSVKKGQILITLDNTQIKAALASSEAAFSTASNDFDRTEKLAKHGYAAKETIDTARAALAEAKAQLALQQQNLDDTLLKAPFDGVVGAKTINVGDYVASATQLVELVNRKILRVAYSLPQNLLSKVKLDEMIKISSKAYPDKTFDAKITFISPTVDSNTGTFLVHATLTNTDNLLAPGEYVDITQPIGEAKTELLIPEAAIQNSIDKHMVFVVKNGHAIETTVTLGKNHDGYVEVLSGLNANDVVVDTGANNLSNNQAVNIVKESNAK